MAATDEAATATAATLAATKAATKGHPLLDIFQVRRGRRLAGRHGRGER